MTDTAPAPEQTDEEYKAALDASINAITDYEVRAALVNHSLILNSFNKILTTLAERQATAERLLLALMGSAVAPKAEPPTVPGVEVRPGTYL